MDTLRVYDKAQWHSAHESFPVDLPEGAGAIYGGFFFAWAYLRGLLSEDFLEEAGDDLRGLSDRSVTPVQVFLKFDGVLDSEMLGEIGNLFAYDYFESDNHDYYLVFEETLSRGLDSPYSVPDSWEELDLLCVALDREFQRWMDGQPRV